MNGPKYLAAIFSIKNEQMNLKHINHLYCIIRTDFLQIILQTYYELMLAMNLKYIDLIHRLR